MMRLLAWIGALALAVGVVGCSNKEVPAESQLPSDAQEAVETSAATQPTIPPYARERARLVHGADEIVSMLENGAVVITKRVVGSPVLSVRGYVRTGGIYEGPWLGGGLSHLLEHLVAGGSNARRSEAESRELLQQLGNKSNAYTTTNHTAYFINTTPRNLDKAVDLLTGWLLHASITEEEFRREYAVVQRELEMGKGEPGRQFYLLANMNRYHVSPVRVPTIGYAEVIQGLTRDDVYRYYKLAYQPNNMVFAIAGDLDPEEMLQSVQRYLDAPAGRVFDHTIPQEPAVMSPRTLVTTMPKLGQANVSLAYPTIRLDHPDLYALDLLAAVIGQSETSPLVREVRDKQLATSISAYSATPEYVEGSFVVTLRTAPDKVDAAIEAVQLVLDKARREPFPEDVVKRAITQMRVDYLRRQQQTENVAASMATDYIATGDIHFTRRYIDRIAKVTPAEMQAVARKYFDNNKLIKTVMLPEEATQARGLPAAAELLRKAGEMATTASSATTRATVDVDKSVMENGTTLLIRRVPTSPLIEVRMYADGGLEAETPETSGIGNLTMSMLTRGTTFRSANQIAEELEAIGASISTACGNNTWYWNASMLREDFEKGMEIFADVVTNPSFPQDELETMRKRVLAAIAAQDASWSSQALRFFRKKYFPETSPYHLQIIGEADPVSRFTADDLKKHYSQKVLTGRRVLAIYGDIEVEKARRIANKLLGGGPKTDTSPRTRPASPEFEPAAQPTIEVARVEVQQTQQPLAGVVIGFNTGSLIAEPDTEIISLADTVTSGWGYPTGYLHETLRGEGLVYVVQAQNWPGKTTNSPGTFLVYAGCEPSRVNEVVDKILLNIARLQGNAEDIQADWFERARQLLITDSAMSNETVAEQASTEALDELWGLGYDWSRTFADRVQQVSIEDVQRLARTRLRQCVVTISTPRPDLVQVSPGTRTFASFPPVELTPREIEHEMPVGQ